MPAYRPSAAMTLPGCSAAMRSAMSESLPTAVTKALAAACSAAPVVLHADMLQLQAKREAPHMQIPCG
jgi:hypothetical protein